MNIVAAIALAVGLPLVVDQCGSGTTVDPLHAVRWAAGQLSVCGIIDSVSAASTTAGDHVMCAGKGAKGKKQKAINPWPTMSEKDDAAVELVMLGIGLVVVLILGCIAFEKGL